MKKYLLYPGWVRSRNDGDIHYVDAPKLADLYGVTLGDCVVVHSESSIRGLDTSEFIKLRPKHSGVYRYCGITDLTAGYMDMFNIAGRGLMIAIDLNKVDNVKVKDVHNGDRVRIKDVVYIIRGIELATSSSKIGLLVKAVQE